MEQTIESLTKQGNTWFLAGNNTKALRSYYKALHHSKALPLVVEYIKKNKDNLYEDKELLKELLRKKYNILLFPEALPFILNSIKKQVEEQDEKKAFQRFKKIILSKHPTTPEQYVDILLEQNENPFWQEIKFLSDILLERGFNYYICDVDQLCHERTRALELARFERSLQEKNLTR